jgi:hypothetical protein
MYSGKWAPNAFVLIRNRHDLNLEQTRLRRLQRRNLPALIGQALRAELRDFEHIRREPQLTPKTDPDTIRLVQVKSVHRSKSVGDLPVATLRQASRIQRAKSSSEPGGALSDQDRSQLSDPQSQEFVDDCSRIASRDILGSTASRRIPTVETHVYRKRVGRERGLLSFPEPKIYHRVLPSSGGRPPPRSAAKARDSSSCSCSSCSSQRYPPPSISLIADLTYKQ